MPFDARPNSQTPCKNGIKPPWRAFSWAVQVSKRIFRHQEGIALRVLRSPASPGPRQTLLIPTFASAQIWDAGLLIHDGSVIGRTKTLPPRQLGPAGVNDQALAAFPSMTTGQKQLAVILFLFGIVGIAFGLLVALFLMFRDQNRDTTKGPKRFFPSNWK